MQFPQNGMWDPSQWGFIHRNLLRDDTQFAELKDDNQFAEKTLEEINYSVKKFDHLKGLLTWRKNDRIIQFEDFVLNNFTPTLYLSSIDINTGFVLGITGSKFGIGHRNQLFYINP